MFPSFLSLFTSGLSVITSLSVCTPQFHSTVTSSYSRLAAVSSCSQNGRFTLHLNVTIEFSFFLLSLNSSTYSVCLFLLLNALNNTPTHTLGRTPLDEGLACRSDLYLKTDNVRKGRTPVPPAGLKPKIPATEGPADPHFRPRSHPDQQRRISLRDFVVILYFISLIFIQSPHPFLRNASIYVSSSV